MGGMIESEGDGGYDQGKDGRGKIWGRDLGN